MLPRHLIIDIRKILENYIIYKINYIIYIFSKGLFKLAIYKKKYTAAQNVYILNFFGSFQVFIIGSCVFTR